MRSPLFTVFISGDDDRETTIRSTYDGRPRIVLGDAIPESFSRSSAPIINITMGAMPFYVYAHGRLEDRMEFDLCSHLEGTVTDALRQPARMLDREGNELDVLLLVRRVSTPVPRFYGLLVLPEDEEPTVRTLGTMA